MSNNDNFLFRGMIKIVKNLFTGIVYVNNSSNIINKSLHFISWWVLYSSPIQEHQDLSAKMHSGFCLVWLFDHPYIQLICLIIEIFKAYSKVKLICHNQKKVRQDAVCLFAKRSEVFHSNCLIINHNQFWLFLNHRDWKGGQ